MSGTATNNFTLDASAADGSMKLARGNAGVTTQDLLTVAADGKVDFPAGLAAFLGANQSIGALSSSGYQKLPGGLIFQWGRVSALASSTSAVSFPVAFPNNAIAVHCSPIPGSAGATMIVAGPLDGSISAAGFTYANTNTSGLVASYWFAIGK